MGRWNVCVYAICKNEEKFAARWMKSMSEADGVYVLDTGSEDRTVSILRELGAAVTVETFAPWRFDTARNRSLELVPEDADICVCTDLDEVFLPGWREQVEAYWNNAVHQLSYRYVWNFREDGSEGAVFWIEKIHARHGFRWVHPVHEVLEWRENTPLNSVMTEGIQCEHHADPTKSRAQYLPLLELAVQEQPENDRNMHYLGREYLFHREWEKCIKTLKRHLSLPSATWADERCASMRFLSQACAALGRKQEEEQWLLRAVGEAPHLREPWLALAMKCYEKEDWEGVLFACNRALSIQNRPRSYICEADAWGSQPYDLASLGYYYTGRYEQAVSCGKEAVKRSPQDQRLRNNLRLMVKKHKEAQKSPEP